MKTVLLLVVFLFVMSINGKAQLMILDSVTICYTFKELGHKGDWFCVSINIDTLNVLDNYLIYNVIDNIDTSQEILVLDTFGRLKIHDVDFINYFLIDTLVSYHGMREISSSHIFIDSNASLKFYCKGTVLVYADQFHRLSRFSKGDCFYNEYSENTSALILQVLDKQDFSTQEELALNKMKKYSMKLRWFYCE
jgi:hypothetical protein